MRAKAKFCTLAGALALLAPSAANATAILTFTGVAGAGSTGSVLEYSAGVDQTSFAGEPVVVTLSITGPPGHAYVDSFSASWSGQTYALPYTTSVSGSAIPFSPEADFSYVGFFSSAGLTNAGGSANIHPSSAFIAFTDGNLDLNLDFLLSMPPSPNGPFTDNAITGGGTISTYLNFAFDPSIGFYDAWSNVSFTVSSVSVTGDYSSVEGVPEPSVWIMALLGFGALGVAARRARTLATTGSPSA